MSVWATWTGCGSVVALHSTTTKLSTSRSTLRSQARRCLRNLDLATHAKPSQEQLMAEGLLVDALEEPGTAQCSVDLDRCIEDDPTQQVLGHSVSAPPRLCASALNSLREQTVDRAKRPSAA